MTRRALFLMPLAAVARPRDLVDMWNEFVQEATQWVALKQAELSNPGTVSAKAISQWKLVKRRFEEVDRVVRNG